MGSNARTGSIPVRSTGQKPDGKPHGFPSGFHFAPNIPLRSIYLQGSRLNLMAVAAVAVVNIVVVDTVVRSWLLRTWLLGHGCSVIAVATESHHITISSYHTTTSYRAVSPYFLLLHSLLHPLPHPLPHSKWTGSPYLAYSDRLHASAAFPAVFR